MSNWPERHVEHLLAGYASGQLNARQAARVQRHTAACADCRARLAAHERLAEDLRLMLAYSAGPSPAQVDGWWQAIRVRPVRRTVRRHVAPVLAPVLAALLITVPMLAGRQHAAQPVQAAATAVPPISRTAEPPHNETSIPGAVLVPSDTPAVMTPSPGDQNAILTPVPPAPTRIVDEK